MQRHRTLFKTLLILCLLGAGILLQLGNLLAQTSAGDNGSQPPFARALLPAGHATTATVRFDGVAFSPSRFTIVAGDTVDLWNDTDQDQALTISVRPSGSAQPPVLYLPLLAGGDAQPRGHAGSATSEMSFPSRGMITLDLAGANAWRVALSGVAAIGFDVDIADATATATPVTTSTSSPTVTPTFTPTPTPGPSGLTVDILDKASVQAFYASYYATAPHPEMAWSGNHDTCDAGTTSPAYRQTLQNLVNSYRAMAGVPADVTFLDTYNAKAQQAALMMSVNRRLSHYPTADWQCFSADGEEAARRSNLSLWIGALPSTYHGIKGQMQDAGANNYTVGHRRWILCPATKQMGTGDVPAAGDNYAANALWVISDSATGQQPAVRDGFVAWPPPGYVPDELVYPRWSFMLRNADFTNAAVTVRYNGAALPVDMEKLGSTGICESTLVWVPTIDWYRLAFDQDHRFTVEIAGVAVDGATRTYTYDVIAYFTTYAGPPLLYLAPDHGPTGTVVEAYGKGLPANTPVVLHLGRRVPNASYYRMFDTPYATGSTDAGGRYLLTFGMPATWPDGSPLTPDTVLVKVSTTGANSEAAYRIFTVGAVRQAQENEVDWVTGWPLLQSRVE